MTLLRSIVYVSTTVRPFNADELEALLLEAQATNRQNGITGVLLHSGNTFMQCFEGADDAVQSTYARIQASRRHHELVELMNAPVGQRTFGSWEMGSANPTPSELLTISSAQWDSSLARSKFSPSSPPGLELLKVFWSMRQQAA